MTARMADLAATLTGNPREAAQPETLTLEALFARGESYGKVTVFGRKDQTYRVMIEFSTIQGVALEASSDGLPLVRAFVQAIERAEKIRSQFK